MKTRRTPVVVLWLSVILALGGALGGMTWAQGASVDPQSLIGEWPGEWTQAAGKQHPVRGPYSLTILRVQGDRVHGQVELSGANRPKTSEFKFEGQVTGNTLSFGRKGQRTELTIEGNRMRGSWETEGRHREVSVTKK